MKTFLPLLIVRSAVLLLLILSIRDLRAGTLTVQSSVFASTPDILAYNLAHFYPGSNTQDWWRYSGMNGARIFISPAEIEPDDDILGTGDGVTSQSSFLARKTALRADPLNTAYINWPLFEDRYENHTLGTASSGNRIRVSYALGKLRELNIEILAQITASETTLPIANGSDWAGKWELWQHYYAQAFYLGKNVAVQRYQMFNEPNHPNANGLTAANWLMRLQLCSDAIQSAIADVNTRYGKALTPLIYAPANSGGDSAYTGWGDLAVANRHKNFLGVTDSNYFVMQRYDYHEYNSTSSQFGSTVISLRNSLTADMAPETRFPLSISEFNVHTGGTFDTIAETLDSPTKYSSFGAMAVNLVKNLEKELYCFKFGQTTSSGGTYPVAKNGMHYVQNGGAPYDTGGATKAAEVYRLFAKALAPGRNQMNYTRDADGSIDPLDLRATYDPVTKNYYVFSANEESSGVTLTIDTTAWNIPAGSRYLLEEVSESRHGSGRTWSTVSADGTLFDGADNQLFQPARTVWLFTIPSQALEAEQIVAASDDATVKDGSKAGSNYGTTTTLLARNDPSSTAARSAAFVKFQMPLIYPPDIQLAVLSVRARTGTTGATAQAHVYGLDNDAWSAGSLTWSNAPNLRQGAAAGNLIADRVITGQGSTAHLLGQLVASSTLRAEKLTDVTAFLREQTDRVASFLITQDPRWDVALPSLASGDTQVDGIDIQAMDGSTVSNPGPRLRIVRLKDTDVDGISDEAETTVFHTNPNVADTDGDGVADGVEILVNETDPLNGPPSISNIADRSIAVNTNTGAIAFTIGDLQTSATALTLTKSSSNPTLAPTSGIVFGGSGANRTVTVTPAANQLGTATITVTVSDGVLTTSDTIVLTVTGTALETWRFANFGTTANTGNAADLADANHDGEENVLEYATAQSPSAASLVALTTLRTASALEITYTRSKTALAGGVTFTVEWSDTLAPNSWSSAGVSEVVPPLFDNGIVQTVKAVVPSGAGGRRFVHLKVTLP